MNMYGGGGGGQNNGSINGGVVGGGGGANGPGPCGACKFLRRKCVKGCIFAPYFDPEQGTTHFAAVHKVFGASNASKMLLRVPAHKRLDTVVTLCYEALARIRDPVYGCVGHLFTLQQQVVNLQAELACAQARLTTLQRLPPPSSATPNLPPCNSNNVSLRHHFDQHPLASDQQTSIEIGSFSSSVNDQELDDNGDDDLQALTQGFVSRYLPVGVKFKPPSSP
ncbi:OLC1v1038935C1 [Oldenlandia corymbosa var. corymbosa]|uniref:OLC1v1038935C1 n=1 Tax=Oldenlandia corymbosa var. corymbosa TaxID=529605 RepID=A0AAV1D1G1_OLDCO|nr:OLC1v1038935C1 [Oldenlandia corymbosa var. corymbosa]